MIPGPKGDKGAAGAGGSGAQGTTTITFGAFPGSGDAFKAVADAAVGASSLARAWLIPVASADHSAHEHMLEKIQVTAEPVAGVGVNIYAMDMNLAPARVYGVWNVAWSWA
jgi:hypothetical protein